jgi:hypothetical protein
MTLTALVDA